MSKELAELRDSKTGELMFRSGFICNLIYSMEFIERECHPDALPTVYDKSHIRFHQAVKKIPYIDENGNLIKPTTNSGVKLESFIFDLMPKINS